MDYDSDFEWLDYVEIIGAFLIILIVALAIIGAFFFIACSNACVGGPLTG